MKNKAKFYCRVLAVFFFIYIQLSFQLVASPPAIQPITIDTIMGINQADTSNNEANNYRESIFNLPKVFFEDSIGYIASFLAILALFITIFITWVGFFSYFQFKEGRQEIKDFKKFKQSAQKEISEQLDLLNTKQEKIIDIEKSLAKNKAYLSESVESLFESLISYANSKKDKESLKLFFISRAISNLYSLEKANMFAGIGKIAEFGDESEIYHLENFISSIDDDGQDLKDLAEIAIKRIQSRI